MQKNSPAVQRYFNSHKTKNEFYFVGTLAFHKEKDAQSHANSFPAEKRPAVVRITREEAFAEPKKESKGDNGSGGGATNANSNAINLEDYPESEEREALREVLGYLHEAQAELKKAMDARDALAKNAAKTKKAAALQLVADCEAVVTDAEKTVAAAREALLAREGGK